jgi:hypothetical protein
MAETSAKPVIQIPASKDDAPPWLRVGVLAAVGLVAGLLWPRLVGLRLGPSAPAEAVSASLGQAAPSGPIPRPGMPSAAGANVANAPVPAATTAAALPKAPVAVGRGYAVSCRAPDGDMRKGKACDTKGLDAVVAPKLGLLGACAGAEQAEGKLSVVLTAEFKRGQLTADIGKSSTVKPNDALLGCVKTTVAGIDIKGVEHAEDRAVVAYAVTFAKAAGEPDAVGSQPAVATLGTDGAAPALGPEVEVGWDVALVRESPKTGAILARLRRGSKVHTLGEPQENWYRVRFGDASSAKDGWVFHAAIGK